MALLPPFEAARGNRYQEPQQNLKVLASGYLSNAALLALYTAPLRVKTAITFGSLFNEGGGTETIKLAIFTNAAATLLIAEAKLAGSEFAHLFGAVDELLVLEPGWAIFGATDTTANAVAYVLTGYEYFIPAGGKTA